MMDPVVRLTVFGRIAPKGSRTIGARRDGSRYTRPASKHEHDWTETVALQALSARPQPRPDAPYRVSLFFHFSRPKHPTHQWPSSLDIDKTTRAVLDGLVRGGLIDDDRHVVALVARKDWADGGENVRVLVEHA